MKHKEKLYFPDWDSCYCHTIKQMKGYAMENDIKEFDAVEAVPDHTQREEVWCDIDGDFVSRCDCNKPSCYCYAPNKSGRGVCIHRRHCYLQGTKKIHIKIK